MFHCFCVICLGFRAFPTKTYKLYIYNHVSCECDSMMSAIRDTFFFFCLVERWSFDKITTGKMQDIKSSHLSRRKKGCAIGSLGLSWIRWEVLILHMLVLAEIASESLLMLMATRIFQGLPHLLDDF